MPCPQEELKMKQKAVDAYTGKNGMRLNCAQAVARAAKDAYGVTDAEIDAYAACGGGRAPDGACGAIHAAHELIAKKSPADAKKASAEFVEAIGAFTCRDIKAAKKRSCMDCVAEAALLAEKYAR